MAESEKVTFGATIQHPVAPVEPAKTHASTPVRTTDPSIRDAPATPLTGVSAAEPIDPFDNFYGNKDAPKTETSFKTPINVYAHDLESQRELGLSRSQTSRSIANGKEDSMWPSLKSLKAKARKDKRAKSKNPMRNFSKKQKWIASAIIALLVIGAAVGIGVGVSKAVGGGVTNMRGGSRPIGGGNDEKRQ